jgi:rhamnulokinase
MWLLKQCIDSWSSAGRLIDLPGLIAQAENIADLPSIINVDAPSLMLAGEMPTRINAQLQTQGLAPIPDIPGNEPIFARLIFQSLARRYAQVLRDLESLTGRRFRRIIVLGGASRNALLARLTEQSTGLPVSSGHAEGSTIGNFAVQLAASNHQPPAPEAIRAWAARLTQASSKHP